MRVLIVHHDTLGLAHDARVLRGAITRATPDCRCTCKVIPSWMVADYTTPLDIGALAPFAPFDCTFLLEHAHANPPLLDRDFSKSVCYVPNMEWLNAADETVIRSGAIDRVWLKNSYSYDLFNSLGLRKHVTHTRCVGWSSDDLRSPNGVIDYKDFDRFLHVKGSSWQKQTDVVMETWADHPEFPELIVVMHGGLDLPRPLSYGSNVKVHHRKIETAELLRLQRSCGVHVIPSGIEGFGHALNEARSVGSLLITTDAQPMNAFVRHGQDGMLVAIEENQARPWGKARFMPISRENLASCVAAIRSLSPADLKTMGSAARQSYEANHRAFELAVAEEIVKRP